MDGAERVSGGSGGDRRRAGRRWAAVLVGAAGLAAAAGFLALSASRTAPRPAPPPVASTGPAARVEANPDDVDARIELVRRKLGEGDFSAAWEETQAVLERSPGNPRALTYEALLRFAGGQSEAAERELREAIDAAPDLIDAHAILALVYAKTGRLAEARKTMDRAEARFPDRKAVLEEMFDQLRSQVKAERAGGGAAALPLPDDAAPLLPAHRPPG